MIRRVFWGLWGLSVAIAVLVYACELVGRPDLQQGLWVTGIPIGLTLFVLAVPYSRELERERRFRAGQCPACGYDLRATPGRCPECGAGVERRQVIIGRLPV